MKSKIVTGILAFFGGWLGVHRFYLGQTGKGFLYMAFFWTGIPALMAFIDGIIFLTMDEDEFNRKYNPDLYEKKRRRNPDYDDRRDRDYAYQREEEARRRVYEQEEEARRLREYIPQRPIANPYREKAEKLYADYDLKVAIEYFQKSLALEAKDPQTHFNLACLYSLCEDLNHAYFHLEKAVNQGFVRFDQIKNHDHLAYLRTDGGFDQFVKNGYRTVADTPRLTPPPEPVLHLTDDVIKKLKAIAELRDKGILTDEEFRLQKELILKR